MNPKWFDKTKDGTSRFEQLHHKHIGSIEAGIAHAFRTLLAEDAAAGGSSHRHEGPLEMFSDCINELNDRIATLEFKVKRLRRLRKERDKDYVSLCARLDHDDIQLRGVLARLANLDAATTPAPTPRPFRVGDRVITNPCDSWSRYVHSMNRLFHEEGEVIEIENEYVVRVKHATGNWKWPTSALELVTAVDAPEAEMNNEYLLGEVKQLEEHLAAMTKNRDDLYEAQQANERTHERGCEDMYNLMGENGKLRAERDSLQAKLAAANADLAAYRARVEAGKVVYGKDLGNGEWVWSPHEYHTIDTRTALLIDEAAIAPAVEQGPMFTRKVNRVGVGGGWNIYTEERKVERRKSQAKGTLDLYGERVFYRSGDSFDPCKRYKASRCTSHPRRTADRRRS